MIGLLKALGILKAAVAVTALTAVTAFAAQTVLPAASNVGQSHAAAAAANAPVAATEAPAQTAAPADGSSADVVAQLQANKTAIVDRLTALLARMTLDKQASPRAIAAIEKVLDRIQNGDTGLNRAIAAKGSAGNAKPTSPPGAANHPATHPSSTDHPNATSHPSSTDHPGKP